MSADQPASTFNQHAAVYEKLIDWPRRLAHEEPFYRRWFEQVGAQRVLDAACGTGHHAAMFHSWGLEVEGADLSPGMIALCRERFGQPAGLKWVVRSFGEPADRDAFDAVVCMGNSLALADDLAAVRIAVSNLLAALRPGGICILGVMNLWRMPEGPTTWQKCLRVQHEDRERILLKSVHRVGSRGYIDFADLDISDASVSPRYDAAEFLGISSDDLLSFAGEHGGCDAELYGSFDLRPYDELESPDLLFVCRREQ